MKYGPCMLALTLSVAGGQSLAATSDGATAQVDIVAALKHCSQRVGSALAPVDQVVTLKNGTTVISAKEDALAKFHTRFTQCLQGYRAPAP